MPIIPLLTQSTPLPNLPAPVLDNQRRPTVDNRGKEAAIGAFADATKQPLLPAKELAAPYDALGSVGKAISETGSVAGALAVKLAEADTYRQVTDADSKMQVVRGQFEQYQAAHPNEPELWQDAWGKMSEPALTGILANPNLRPAARDQIELRGKLFNTNTGTSVGVSAAKQTFKLASDANEGAIANKIEAQDEPGFQAEVQRGVQAGWLPAWKVDHYQQAFEAKGELLKKKAEADAYDTAQNTVAGIAAGKGAAAAQEAIDNGTVGNFAPADKEKLKGYAKQIGDSHSADSMSSLLDGIYSGKITNPARIDEVAQGDPHLTPVLVAKAKDDLARLDLRAAAQDREQNGVLHAVELRHAAEDYSRAQDPDGTKFFELKAAIKRGVPEGMGNEISNLLDQKFSGKLGALPAAPETETLVKETLRNVFDPIKGVLPWRTPEVQRYPKDTTTGGFFGIGGTSHKQGEPVLDSNKKEQILYDKNGQVRKYTDDLKVKEQAEIQEADLYQKMRTWMQGNPSPANDPKAVTKKLMELVPEGARGAMYQGTLQKTLTPQASAAGSTSGATLTSYGYAGDSTPDSRSAAGIGAFTPKEEETKIRAGKDSWFKLRAGDIAASPDVEKQFMAKGISAGDMVGYQLSNGETRQGRFMDRTAQDAQIAAGKVKGVTQPLRGRIDTYSPGGKDKATGARVVKWWKIEDTTSST